MLQETQLLNKRKKDRPNPKVQRASILPIMNGVRYSFTKRNTPVWLPCCALSKYTPLAKLLTLS